MLFPLNIGLKNVYFDFVKIFFGAFEEVYNKLVFVSIRLLLTELLPNTIFDNF